MKARAQLASLVSVAAVVGLFVSIGWVMFPSVDDSAGCFPDSPSAGWGAHPWFVVGIGATIGVALLILAVRFARRHKRGQPHYREQQVEDEGRVRGLAAPVPEQQPLRSREGVIDTGKEHAAMLQSPAAQTQNEQERRSRTSINQVATPGVIWYSRAREPSKPRLDQRDRPMPPTDPEF